MNGPATILLLDNEDSFVWNLAQAFQVLGADVAVRRSNRTTLAQVRALAPRAIVLSPGPGRPEDAGICIEVVRRLSGAVPILGVCLGHQAIGAAFGGTVREERPCHGKAWTIRHDAQGLFAGLPSPLTACRYHSLVVEPSSLPAVLQAQAWTPEGVLMALRHRVQPTFGVQFHPESFRTEHGLALLRNFLAAAAPADQLAAAACS